MGTNYRRRIGATVAAIVIGFIGAGTAAAAFASPADAATRHDVSRSYVNGI